MRKKLPSVKKGEAVTIVAAPGELEEGLVGGIFLFAFEILPALRKFGIFPNWSIASRLYGEPPDWEVIPGTLDLAYHPPADPRPVPLAWFRERHSAILGSDWTALNHLWSAYFTIPPRITEAADKTGDLGRTLGVHYRGNDKTTNKWDSNAISYDEFYLVVGDFLRRRPEFTQLLVATDEAPFIDFMRDKSGLDVVSLGAGKFHKTLDAMAGRRLEADRALLDCVLLSRCGAVLQTSSALSAFAKVLRPELEIYRCAASKMFTNVPYFPTAYIPAYTSEDEAVRSLMQRTMTDDWATHERAGRFQKTFAYRPRRSLLSRLRRLAGLAVKTSRTLAFTLTNWRRSEW